MTFFISLICGIESGERAGIEGANLHVPCVIKENGRLVIHSSMGNFVEAIKIIRYLSTRSCRKFDRRFDKRQN